MNSVELLQKEIVNRFPFANINIDPPENPNEESWFLNVALNGKLIIIGWKQGEKWFGVTDYSEPKNNHEHGGVPDKTYGNINSTLQGVVDLLSP